jgi:tRNA pseudouridine55 synthase
VLVLDKPSGPTSHDVVARVRRLLGLREVGHAGTLDPMATGVLVVALGEATKLVPYLTMQEKAYDATLGLGVATDTLDALGREVVRSEVGEGLRAALVASRGALTVAPVLAAALDAERERTTQLPPAFSAIRQGGERAHTKARRGEEPALEPRPVRVVRLRLLDAGDEPGPWMAVELEVSKGYYVRALARDLAARLGTVGHLTALRRTRSGAFRLAEALPLDTAPDELEARVLPLELAAERVLPVARLSATGVRDAGYGRTIAAGDIEATGPGPAPGPHAWLDPDGRLVAVGELRDDGLGHVLRGFTSPSSAS